MTTKVKDVPKVVKTGTVKIKKETKTPVDNSNIPTFFKLVALQGDIECPEAVFDVQEERLDASVISSDRTLAMKGHINGSFEKFGKIGISYLPSLVKFFDTVGSAFELAFTTSTMVLKSGKTKLTTTIQNAEYIANKLEDERYDKIDASLKEGLTLSLSKEIISDIISKFNTLKGEIFKFEVEDDVLYVTIKNKTTDTTLETEYKLESSVEGKAGFEINQRFAFLFDTLAKTMTKEDKIIIRMAEEKGVAVSVSLTNSILSVNYIVALLKREE